MHKTAVAYSVGKLMQIMGLLLLVPMAIGVYDHRSQGFSAAVGHPDVYGFVLAALLTSGLGSVAVRIFRGGRDLMGVREGLAIVAIGWVTLTFFSCLPMFVWLLYGPGVAQYSVFGAFTDAYFEIMSGFTTTGATILTNIEAAPRSILFLRALTHWLGGMGIITLAIVVFPGMGITAYQMFKSEVPGPHKEKLSPRLSQTTAILWGVYGLLTGAQTILLIIGGMTPFEAICHAFATMATGGFSTENTSIAAYQSEFIRWVIIIFMWFAGVNFLLHFRALRGNIRGMFYDREFIFYNSIILIAIVVITAILHFHGPASFDIAADSWRYGEQSIEEFSEHYREQSGLFSSLYQTFRIAAFQTIAIVTTTGFATADFDMWPNAVRFILVLLMFLGGCAGSTGGGIKMVRIMIVVKVIVNAIRKRAQPKLVVPVKVGGQVVDDNQVLSVLSFLTLFIGLFVATGLLMTLFVDDLTTAVACSIATIGNIGPGLAGIGAVENYGWIPLPGKWILVASMLLGRLEIFTVLVILRPGFWRK
ncbi:TrkH family potassium uptake protein [candidate division GN15 bacterium]|nr:TrkH family potassium uptake protein [candidate division GN15 bacterium]